MKNILVTGGSGQLATCIKGLESHFSGLDFIYTSSSQLDITNLQQTIDVFSSRKFDWCINCAAYTAVDKAETESDQAYNVNHLGVINLAEACNRYDVNLIHISTDFVFDGGSEHPYTELDTTNPIGVYGDSKLKGEVAIRSALKKYFILRTSWLYSEHCDNFLKTMLKLSETKDEINVVSDQIGTPTYAGDLGQVILEIIMHDSKAYGTYHYSNEGEISWYDFAVEIFKLYEPAIKINPIGSSSYPTLAKRPMFSVLNKSKIKQAFNLEIPNWKESLKRIITKKNE